MIRCPLCDSACDAGDLLLDELMFRTGQTFRYSTCSGCGTLVLAEAVDDANLYPAEYYSISRDPDSEFSSLPFRVATAVLSRLTLWRRRRLLALIRVFTPMREARTLIRMLESVASALPRTGAPRILDVGTGSGYLPYVLNRDPRSSVRGIDPHMSESQAAAHPYLSRSTIDQLPGDERWDVIVFNHSLEHMHDASAILSSARSRLAPGGRIVVRVPTISCRAFDLYGTKMNSLDPPRHVFIPSRRGLARCATRLGLRVVRRFDDSSSPQFWLNDHIVAGRSTMDPDTGFRTFRPPGVGPHRLATQAVRSWWANRTRSGDQLCLVLETAQPDGRADSLV